MEERALMLLNELSCMRKGNWKGQRDRCITIAEELHGMIIHEEARPKKRKKRSGSATSVNS